MDQNPGKQPSQINLPLGIIGILFYVPLSLCVCFFVLYICLGTFIGLAIVPLMDWDGTSECKNDVVSDMPVFSQATIINEKSNSDTPRYGSIEYTYKTPSEAAEVIDFYADHGSCIFDPNGVTSCSGNVKNLLFYQATIDTYNFNHEYQFYFYWQCGLD